MTKNLVTRRSFMQVSAAAGGGMLIALHLDPAELLAQGPPGGAGVRYDALAFVKIAPDGIVTVMTFWNVPALKVSVLAAQGL